MSSMCGAHTTPRKSPIGVSMMPAPHRMPGAPPNHLEEPHKGERGARCPTGRLEPHRTTRQPQPGVFSRRIHVAETVPPPQMNCSSDHRWALRSAERVSLTPHLEGFLPTFGTRGEGQAPLLPPGGPTDYI